MRVGKNRPSYPILRIRADSPRISPGQSRSRLTRRAGCDLLAEHWLGSRNNREIASAEIFKKEGEPRFSNRLWYNGGNVTRDLKVVNPGQGVQYTVGAWTGNMNMAEGEAWITCFASSCVNFQV